MQLICFISAEKLKPYMFFHHSYLMYPRDEKVKGSSYVFGCLTKRMREKKLVGLVWFQVRTNSEPRLAAILPDSATRDPLVRGGLNRSRDSSTAAASGNQFVEVMPDEVGLYNVIRLYCCHMRMICGKKSVCEFRRRSYPSSKPHQDAAVRQSCFCGKSSYLTGLTQASFRIHRCKSTTQLWRHWLWGKRSRLKSTTH